MVHTEHFISWHLIIMLGYTHVLHIIETSSDANQPSVIGVRMCELASE